MTMIPSSTSTLPDERKLATRSKSVDPVTQNHAVGVSLTQGIPEITLASSPGVITYTANVSYILAMAFFLQTTLWLNQDNTLWCGTHTDTFDSPLHNSAWQT